MKEHWLEVLEWIQLALTLSFLVVMAGILAVVLRFHKLEFNVLWKTRVFIIFIAIMWAFSLLLGRQQLWAPDDGLIANSQFEGLCRAHVFLTFGLWQPLFFLTILMVLRSKEKSKMELHFDDPNKFIIYNALLWCIPIFTVHIVIIALSAVNEKNPLVWATYTVKHQHCVIPILSTTTFAAFYCCFVLFYIISSRKLFKRLINHNLRNRIRWTQLFFVFFFPVEIVVRFFMIFISKYEDAYQALYHTYFFMDLIVCCVAVSELVLLPVLDAASYPLLAGVTAQACKEYEKSEEVKKQRRNTRPMQPMLQRGMSVPAMDGARSTPQDNTKDYKDLNEVELQETKSTFGISEDPPLKRNPSKHIASIIRTPSSSSKHTGPADSKPILHLSEEAEGETEIEMDKNTSLHVRTPAASYPAHLEDIFADMDEAGDEDALENSSLKFKVDGIFISDDYPSSSSQR